MTEDCHVRFCERLGVKFPLPTRPLSLCLIWYGNLLNEYFIFIEYVKV